MDTTPDGNQPNGAFSRVRFGTRKGLWIKRGFMSGNARGFWTQEFWPRSEIGEEAGLQSNWIWESETKVELGN